MKTFVYKFKISDVIDTYKKRMTLSPTVLSSNPSRLLLVTHFSSAFSVRL